MSNCAICSKDVNYGIDHLGHTFHRECWEELIAYMDRTYDRFGGKYDVDDYEDAIATLREEKEDASIDAEQRG